jgi:hypothetical protein
MPPEEISSQPGGAGTEHESGERQSEDRLKPGFEPTEEERTVVEQWLKRAARAEDATAAKEWRDSLENLRRYERGKQTVDDKKSRTNMVYATIAAQMPELYAKNPTIAVTPTDAVPQGEMGKVKAFAGTAEKVIRKMLVEEGKLKKRAKANIRSASVTSFGVLKVLYQQDYRGDPIAVRRLEDTQDNLARVEALVAQLKKTDDPTELAKKRDELRANLEALKAGNELELFKGFTIDRVKSEDFLVLDDNVAEFDEYVDADALGHRIWMTVADAKARFQLEKIAATRYGRPRSDANGKTDDTPADEQFICVIEIWDKKAGVIRTTAKGMNRWLREPYAPQFTPQRWYSFYVLGFNITEGEWRPLADTELLASLQDEYDRTRQNYADVREKAVPKRIVRKGGNLSEGDVKNIMESGNTDWVAVEGNPAIPISQDVMDLPAPKIDPAAYDVSLIRNDMDLVTGRSDASRANLIKPKTATEAEIMADAMQSRVGERRDTHEDLLSEMGEASLEILLRALTQDEVRQIAGDDAAWPETPQGVAEAFKQVSVKVRAGSSGKPNQQKEREQWGQLLPVIKETMQGVAELRAAGNLDMANATLELLRETLRRYDEHIDLDAIIPPMDENGTSAQMQQLAAGLAQCKQELAQCQEDLAKCQQDLQAAKSGEAAKVRAAELDAQAEGQAALRKASEQAIEDERARNEQAVEDQRQHELAVAQEAAKAEAERTRQMEIDREDKLARDRMEREFQLKEKQIEAHEASAVEIARINADAKTAQMAATAEAGEKAEKGKNNDLGELLQVFRDFVEADRVPVYGADGMPERVRIEKKKAKETVQ